MFRRVAVYTINMLPIVIYGFMGVLGQSSELDVRVKESLDKAKTAYLKNDFALAKQELQRVQAVKKDLAEPYLLLGMIAWQEGKIGDAIKSVKDAIKYQPNYSEAHYVMGRLYFEKRNWKVAEEEAGIAINQGAKSANIYVLLGDAALMQERNELAVKAYENAVAAPPPNNEITSEVKAKLAAVKNTLEIMSHRGDSAYKLPQMVKGNGIPHPPLGVTGKVKLAGILTENGELKYVVLLSPNLMTGNIKELINFAMQNRFTPAMKNGVAVPFWHLFTYENRIM